MKNCNHVVIFVLMTTASLMASAEEVYKSRDKQGHVEFSDESSPGATVVDIEKPTIVHLEPVKPVEEPASSEVKKSAAPVQPKVIYEGENYDDDYYHRNRLPREELLRDRKEERWEHREDRVDTGQRPVHREDVNKGTVHRSGEHNRQR